MKKSTKIIYCCLLAAVFLIIKELFGMTIVVTTGISMILVELGDIQKSQKL